MPMPPASATALLLSTRSLVPRSQSTILPLTLAGSRPGPPGHVLEKHSAAAVEFATSPAAAESTSGPLADTRVDEMPLSVTPLPRIALAEITRLCVPAATVVSHGLGCATVLAVGPLLPADAATNTPASAAY